MKRSLSVILIGILLCLAACSKKVEAPEKSEEVKETPKDQAKDSDKEAETKPDKEKPTEPSEETDAKSQALEKQVSEKLASMSMEEKVGQLIMADFRRYDGKNLTVYNEEIGKQIRDNNLGGIILFRENCTSRNQTKQLVKDFQSQAEMPLMIAIDQEGGLVTRLPYAPTMPGNMALGATRDTGLAEEVGMAIGSELSELGIHIDFAPDIDVNSNEDNPVIGVRSFGDNPEIVSEMGIAYMEGLHKTGVAAVGKHFPGHGDVGMDSHLVLPSSNKTLDQLRTIELVPFQRLMDAGLNGIMTAHITFPQIETDTAESEKDGLPIHIPATLSPRFLTDLVRHEMGYEGLVFTDAMDMKAIASHFGEVDAAIRAIRAGADVVLMPSSLKLVYEGLIQAVEDGRITKERLDGSVKRILRFKYEYIINQDKDAVEFIDGAERVAVEEKVANASITVVKDDGFIPMALTEGDKVAIIGFSDLTINRMYNAMKEEFWKLSKIKLIKSLNSIGKLVSKQKAQLEGVTKIILVTNTSNKSDSKFQSTLVQEVLTYGVDTVVVAARNPYELDEAVGAKITIAQYDDCVASFTATVRILVGKQEAQGMLPVKID